MVFGEGTCAAARWVDAGMKGTIWVAKAVLGQLEPRLQK